MEEVKIKYDVSQVSDGYHTFEELYFHRMILFSCLCVNNEDAWKSKLHSDGTMFDDYFIVGIGTEKGKQSTYHYHISKWSFFACLELDKAPEFDGHTAEDSLRRLGERYHKAMLK